MKHIVYLIVILNLAAHAQAQTLKSVTVTGSEEIQLRLKNLEAAVPGIKYQVHQDTLDLKSYEDKLQRLKKDDTLRHRVILLNVDRTRCQQLKTQFSGERSLVDCESLKNNPQEIDLRAFLEPVIQAVEGKTFLNQKVLLSPNITMEDGYITKTYPPLEELDSQGSILMRTYSEETNCWGISWEIARRSNFSFDIQAGSRDLNNFLQDKKNVTDVIPATKDLTQKLSSIKYGDILIVSDKKTGDVYHVATFIDQQLLFEKEGNTVQFPFRLSKLDQITGLYSKRGPLYRVVRAKGKFPSAKDVEKNWTYSFGPKDEDYEGLSEVTYHQPVTFKLVAQDSKYVLSDRSNAYSEDTVTKLESASNEDDILTALRTDEFVTKTLTAAEISALAQEIHSPKYPDLSKKALLLRGLYFRQK